MVKANIKAPEPPKPTIILEMSYDVAEVLKAIVCRVQGANRGSEKATEIYNALINVGVANNTSYKINAPIIIREEVFP